MFSLVLDRLLNSNGNLFVQGFAGTGKSLLIKIFSSMRNCVVLSTTGITALNLCTDDVKASTIHSFFLLPPVDLIPEDSTVTHKIVKNVRAAKTIVIDEASMMSSQLFDAVVKKVAALRGSGQGLPRFVLFGDVMQLPPVVNMNDVHVREFYDRNYGGKLMFFNSNWFDNMSFEVLTLRRIFRQSDAEYRRRLIEIGFNEFDQSTLDYFNSRVTSVKDFEADHPFFIRLAPDNKSVNNINAKYVSEFPGTPTQFRASHSKDWKGTFPNDELVVLKPGIQVMCLRNSYDVSEGEEYRNGSVGVVRSLDAKGAEVELSTGKITRVGIHTQYQYVADVDQYGDVKYVPKGHFTQIDCKPCKACTIHKSQGKTIENAYLQVASWTPESLLYVGLSRTPEISGLGLNRVLTKKDIKINMEAWEFLQDPGKTGVQRGPDPDWDAPVGGD